MTTELNAHPLDPLDADELSLAARILRDQAAPGSRVLFEQIRLLEPDKSVVRNFTPGQPIQRRAFAVMLDRDQGQVFEGTVDLSSEKMESWRPIPDVQICVTHEECAEFSRVVKQHPEFLRGLALRGIENLDQVRVEFFPMSNFASAEERHLRLSRAHCFFVENPGDNPHVRPIEGLVPVIDLNAMQVLRIEDYGVVPVPADKGSYRVDQMGGTRKPLAALQITQPDGPDFEVDNWKVTWQNWSFRVGFTPKEGLVLHALSYRHEGTARPVVYRASLSELVVPYGEVAGDHYMNHSFDLGEGVFGLSVNSLRLGCDCLGEIHYFDVDQVNGHGEVVHFPNAICMHEEDYGILWKHTDPGMNHSEARRSRRLVVSSFFTIGNYDYGIFWYLYLDGTVEFEAKLTGMLYTRALKEGETSPYGTMVAPNLSGMIHEHYFNVRLDMSVDGDENTLVEVEAERVPPGQDNPFGNAHCLRETVIESESQSGRDTQAGSGRYWKVINRSRKNRLGWNPGYRLVPGSSVRPMHQPHSHFMRRAGFVEHNLWVTAFSPEEIHAPGNYVNQGENGPGIPQWVKQNRNLADTDIVLWHTLGVLHMPRPEDYPVMPVEYTGFMLKPEGFFESNPALDLAPPECHVGQENHRSGKRK